MGKEHRHGMMKRAKALYAEECVYCGSKKNLTVDHLLPLVHGGCSHEINIVIACASCNHEKDSKIPGYNFNIQCETRKLISEVQKSLREKLSVTQSVRQQKGLPLLKWIDVSSYNIYYE